MPVRVTFSLWLLLALSSPPALSAEVGSNEQAVVRRLLDASAPAPDWEAATNVRPRGRAPADDEPIDVLVAFWCSDDLRDLAPGAAPTAKVRGRLLEAALQKPDRIPLLLRWLPETPEAFDRLKAVHDKLAPPAPDSQEDLRLPICGWLMMRSRYFREDLVRAAEAAKWEELGYIEGGDEMQALAKLDWAAAEPLLKKQAGGHEPHVAAAAKVVLYEHHAKLGDKAAAEMRAGLRAIVEDKKAVAFSRARAIDALMASTWDGRDSWFLSLFSDATLMDCEEHDTIYGPLRGAVARDPDHWIPLVARMVGDKDTAVHDNAVTCLIQFQLGTARKDALAPLLPWLSKPDWSSARDRLRLVQSLDRVDLPESVPGLLWVLQNESEYEQAAAAEALGHYRAKEAVPALKQALEKDHEDVRGALVVALLACDALTDDDIAKAIEAYARDAAANPQRPQGLFSIGPRLPVQVELGTHLSRLAADRLPVAERLLARAEELQAKEPKVADALQTILAKWPAPAVDRSLIARLRASADLATIADALERPEHLRKNVGPQLREIAQAGRANAGVAAAVLADPAVCRRLLRGDDTAARQMLLACARLLRTPLPVEDVAPLLDAPDALLALAAERYLESEDGPQARALILARHPGEVRILGARMAFDPGHYTYGAFDRIEERLSKEIRRPDGPDQVIALLTAGYWGDDGQRIVRVKGDAVTLSVESGRGKCLSRTLTKEEFAQLTRLISEHKVDDLPPLNTMVFDGMQVEYVRLAREGGRRVFMNNPGTAGSAGSAYDLLTRCFRDLGDTGRFQVHYALQDSVKGAEVVLWDKEHPLQAVWKNGDDLRVLVEDRGWRAVRQGRLDKAAEEPDACPVAGGSEDIAKDTDKHPSFSEHLNRWRWQAQAGGDVIRAADEDYGEGADHGGLWRCSKGKQPRIVCRNAFARPVVTPDGAWAVAPRSDGGWAGPHPIIRVNLATGEQLPIDVGPADSCEALCYVPAHKKVLISLTTRGGPEDKNEDAAVQAEHLVTAQMGVRTAGGAGDKTEFRLLDPATGKTEVVRGEFGPLDQLSYRPLQATRNADEAWAAIPDSEATRIGRYDMKQFAFTPVLTLPEVVFTSMDMWVDEAEGAVYIVTNGDLLRVPLK